MQAPIFVCGAECGLAEAGAAGPGVEHWSSLNGPAPTVVSTDRGSRGVRAFEFSPVTQTSNISHTFETAIASPGVIVTRMYVYFVSLPTGDVRIWGAAGLSVIFESSDSSLRAGGASVSNQASSGKVITTGVWYRLDIKAERNTTNTCDLSVDGDAQAQYSVSGSASTITAFAIGLIDTTTAQMRVDDIIVSGSSLDFPIGPGEVVGLYPNGDGTHVYSSSTDFTKDGSNTTALNIPSSGETTSWQTVNKPLSFTVDTGNYLRVVTTTTTEYLQWAFENLPAITIDAVNAIMSVYTAQGSGGSTGSAGLHLRMNNGGNLADLSNNLTVANATLASFTKTFPTAPGGSAWTDTLVNGLYVEIVGSADKTPIPELHGLCLEVDFVEQTTISRSISPVVFTLIPQALTGFAGIILSPVALTLTPLALTTSLGTASASISPVIFTLSPAVIRGPDPNPISRFPKVIQIVQS